MALLILIAIVVLAGIASITFLWNQLTNEPGSLKMGDGAVGERMDAGEDVRRINLGTDPFKAHIIHSAIEEMGLDVSVHTTTMGGLMASSGSPTYLMYRAADEEAVTTAVDEIAADMEATDDPTTGL